MLLPGPESLMSPCTASQLLLSPSPHSAHVPLSGLLTLLVGFHFFVIGVLADYGPPIAAAARPLICHGPLYRLLMLLPVQSLSWVPVRPPIAAVSIATLCHVPLSGLLTLLVCSIFC
ncbi:unnamed protein product, partial [Staurois parvus]